MHVFHLVPPYAPPLHQGLKGLFLRLSPAEYHLNSNNLHSGRDCFNLLLVTITFYKHF